MIEIFLLSMPLVLGGLFLGLVKWARMRNEDVNRQGHSGNSADGWHDLTSGRGKPSLAVEKYFVGNLPESWTRFGKVLMLLVIAFVSATLASLLVLIIRHIGSQ